MARRSRDGDGFGAFLRRYTKTWIHAVATAALTGFGILTFVHRLFAVLAVAAYVLPPVALYLGGSSTTAAQRLEGRDGSARDSDGDSADENGASRGGGSGTEDGPADPAWTATSVPTGEALHDVAVVDGSAYAVGADGGVFVAGSGAEEWTAVVDDGPGADSNVLRGVAAAGDDGIWFAGDGGALGRLDPATDRHVDHSAPDGDTSSIADVAAASDGTTELVLLADGSGRVRRGRYRDGEIAWDEPVTPGSGSSVVDVTTADASTAYACDSDQSVFRTRDGGRSFERIGVDGPDGTLTDVAAGSTPDGNECAASADDGVVHRFDGANWTPDAIGEGAIHALAASDGRGLGCGDGGTVYECGAAVSARGRSGSRSGGTDWRRQSTPATVTLRGCGLDGSVAVAVGDDGTVVSRTRDDPESVGDAR